MATDKIRQKNAPLEFNDDRSDFVEWATSIPDGAVGAGWQSLHPEDQRKRDDAWLLATKLEECCKMDVGDLAEG